MAATTVSGERRWTTDEVAELTTDKPAFGAADRGDLCEEPNVTGDAEAAGMRQSLTVTEDDIGLVLEFAERGQEGGSFAKGEAPRDIGE